MEEQRAPTLEQIMGMAAGSVMDIPSLEDIFVGCMKGKVALVTGGTTGLGFNVTNRLAEAGAKVVVASRVEEKGTMGLGLLKSRGYDVTWTRCDVTKVADCYAAVDFTVETYGRIDILVANAAVWDTYSFLDMPEDKFDAVLDTDLKGEYFVAQAAARKMVAAGDSGKIVLVGSVARHGIDQENLGMMTHYNAAKGGVASMTRGIAKELAQYGINVNCVCPGGMLTMGAMVNGPEAMGLYGPEFMQLRMGSSTPLAMNPDVVARAIFAMCTPMSDFMYGEVFDVDGGVKLSFQAKPFSYTMKGCIPGRCE